MISIYGHAQIANRTAANLTHGSHVMQYGDMELSVDALFQYMGSVSTSHSQAPCPMASAPSPMDAASFLTSSENVDQRDTELFYLTSKVCCF